MNNLVENCDGTKTLKHQICDFLSNFYNEEIITLDEYVTYLKKVNQAEKEKRSIVEVSFIQYFLEIIESY